MTAKYAGPPATIECGECGFVRTCRTPALADKALAMHSCEHQRMLVARADRVRARVEAAGSRVDCTHKRAHHEHGTRTAYVLDRCRCRPCREASCAAERARSRAKAFGRYDSGRVDAQPVRERLQELMAYGIGLKRIARLAGVSNATLGKILYGDASRNMPPRARVERHVHDRVMAVEATMENLGRTVCVDGLGTRRRLQALVYIGYSQSYLAGRVGMSPGNFARTIAEPARRNWRNDVHAETARVVSALYLELQNKPRVGTDQRSRISVSRAKRHARVNGWLPPAAWDEELMDDLTHKGYPEAVAS